MSLRLPKPNGFRNLRGFGISSLFNVLEKYLELSTHLLTEAETQLFLTFRILIFMINK